ncbi:MAG: hypothetical protein ACI9OJ_000575 [Myxococcota bacterium]
MPLIVCQMVAFPRPRFRLLLAAILAPALVLGAPTEAEAFDFEPRTYDLMRLKGGLVVPYPLDNIFRGYGRCRRGRHTHRALDVGGVGPDWGIGTPIRAMARSKVIVVGTPESDPKRYGQRDIGDGTVVRGKMELPRKIEVPGYGTVRSFTTNYGRLRTGVLVVTRVRAGRLKGYEIKYMHLSAVHPAVVKGAILEAGQEIGLMGGTAVQQDPPHLHLAITNRVGEPVDPARILGIGSSYIPCGRGKAADMANRQKLRRSARSLMRKLKKQAAQTPVIETIRADATWPLIRQKLFADPRERGQRFRLPAVGAPLIVRLEATGKWHPRIKLLDHYENLLFDGSRKRGAGRKLQLTITDKGRRSQVAEIRLEPAGVPLLIQLGSWRRRPPRDATYNISMSLEANPPEALTP